ncbi:conserved hypothetical protein [Xenorhabdus nematophila F1]|uniref:Uncharacterized protein n=1 Tax=Xenorhabdus nematophila (strain ATCC 19061 / DSM 3370 / CCUG 14189 / LMG 1036 / NCIMB 9965 / AN6) TaxID=406817 RepID=D3VBD4_XENNA|nr:hypothetical protein XNC1_1510 [Xenorhabdus nematophila ATCC 19061]CCW29487.1 conserved hypothetical protein [Xenorhabdus nematophila F1]
MTVSVRPKVAASNTTMMGFNKGEENKNTIIGPKPALARINPFNIGIVEQLQKGVIDPRAAARIYPLFRLALNSASTLDGGTCRWRRPINKLTPMNKADNSMARKTNIFRVSCN